MARDNRTRLNAELAHQYGGSRKRGGDVTPGRSSLTETLDETGDVEMVDEVEEQVEVQAEQAPERESRKSIFELPRRESARAPVLPGYSEEAPAEASAPPAPPEPPSGSRRR